MTGYHPMTLANLAYRRLTRTPEGRVRWKLVWEPAAFRKHGVYLAARDLEAA